MTPIQISIMKAVDAATKPEGADWSEIVKIVGAENKIRKNGWLNVRGHLQGLINGGVICRFPSVHIEAYKRV